MSGESKGINLIEDIKDKYSDSPLSLEKPLLVISSYEPHSVISASILCRAAFQARNVFHTKFVNPLIQKEQIEEILDNNTNHSTISVGIEIVGKPASENFLAFLRQGDYPLSLQTYGFAAANMQTAESELGMGILGIYAEESNENKYPSWADYLLSYGEELSVIRKKKGFRIPGGNYLPIVESLARCIHPYLDGLSGMKEACEKLLDDADIPLAQRSGTIDDLEMEQRKQLSANLVTRLPPHTISQILGTEFELLTESPTSPLRNLSGLMALLNTAWSKGSFGLAMGVLLGDRGRTLKKMQNLYNAHSADVLDALQKIIIYLNSSDAEVENMGGTLSAPIEGIPAHVLVDVGRILLDSSLGDADSVIFTGSEYVMASWKNRNASLSEILKQIYSAGFSVIAASSRSVKIPNESDSTVEEIRRIIHDLG